MQARAKKGTSDGNELAMLTTLVEACESIQTRCNQTDPIDIRQQLSYWLY